MTNETRTLPLSAASFPPIPTPLEFVARYRAALAEDLRVLDSEIADLRTRRFEVARKLQDYSIAGDTLVRLDQSIAEDRIEDDYIPCPDARGDDGPVGEQELDELIGLIDELVDDDEIREV